MGFSSCTIQPLTSLSLYVVWRLVNWSHSYHASEITFRCESILGIGKGLNWVLWARMVLFTSEGGTENDVIVYPHQRRYKPWHYTERPNLLEHYSNDELYDVHIQAPHAREWDYVNRKARHSINVQLVGNADLIVTNCVVRWPVSVHNARILRASHLFQRFQQTAPDGILLCNSNYPLLPWLMTPFATVTNGSQQRYNKRNNWAPEWCDKMQICLPELSPCGDTESLSHHLCLHCAPQHSTNKKSATTGGSHQWTSSLRSPWSAASTTTAAWWSYMEELYEMQWLVFIFPIKLWN